MNIKMVQTKKIMMIVAVLGAIATAVNLGMVTSVQASRNNCNWGWDCCNTNVAACNNGVIEQPQTMVKQVDFGGYDNWGHWRCIWQWSEEGHRVCE